MAACFSELSGLLQLGDVVGALATIVNYRQVLSTQVANGDEDTKLVGHVVHVSKGKRLTFQRTSGPKRAIRDAPYFRLVFCREHNSSGNIYAVIYGNENAEAFRSSSFAVGRGVYVVSPQLEGVMFGHTTLLTTNEPLLPGPDNYAQYVPWPIPQSGFTAMAFRHVHLRVTAVSLSSTCGGRMCDGRYGLGGKCPCCRTCQLPRPVLAIKLGVADVGHHEFTSSVEVGLHFEAYMSTSLTERLVADVDLEPAASAVTPESFAIIRHARAELRRDDWNVLAWLKIGAVVDDGQPSFSKAHIVALDRVHVNRFQPGGAAAVPPQVPAPQPPVVVAGVPGVGVAPPQVPVAAPAAVPPPQPPQLIQVQPPVVAAAVPGGQPVVVAPFVVQAAAPPPPQLAAQPIGVGNPADAPPGAARQPGGRHRP